MRSGISGYVFILGAVLYLLLLMMYPMIYNVNLSLHDVSFVTFVKGGSPWSGLKNYRDLLQDPLFFRVLFNTMVFWIGSISLQFTIGFLLALLFDKGFPLKNLYLPIILLPWFIPLTVSGAIFRWFLYGTGFINSFLLGVGLIQSPIPWITNPNLAIYSLTFANVWLGIPFNFILLFTGLKAIPLELYESAEIDGAKEWQKTLYISIPFLKPVIVMTILLGSIFTIKVFDLVWVITRGGPGGASHLLSTLSYSVAFDRFRFGYSCAVVVLMMIMVIVLTIVINRIKVE